MKLYGTTTSPFVRRVRVIAAEVGEPVDRIDTATDAGMAQLRAVSPIRKVPVAVLGERTIFDSRAIVAALTAARGWGELADGYDDNVINAIDAALDSVIQLFYLRRDGVAIDGTPYAVRQLERADAIFAWLAGKLSATRLGFGEIALVCALDWMDFRNTYPTEKAGFGDVRAAWRERPSLAITRPHA